MAEGPGYDKEGNETTNAADRRRMDYNHYRPHGSLRYLAPAAFASKCLEQGSATLGLPQDEGNTCDILSWQLAHKTGEVGICMAVLLRISDSLC